MICICICNLEAQALWEYVINGMDLVEALFRKQSVEAASQCGNVMGDSSVGPFLPQLLSEEVFDFSRGEMTQQKIKELKNSLNR